MHLVKTIMKFNLQLNILNSYIVPKYPSTYLVVISVQNLKIAQLLFEFSHMQLEFHVGTILFLLKPWLLPAYLQCKVEKILFSKVCWQHLATNVLPLHLKHMFPLLICIFTEGEGDVIESRLPFKIFSTLLTYFNYKELE